MREAKADLIPTEANLLRAYSNFRELIVAYDEQIVTLNEWPHRATRPPPLDMLAEEGQHLHAPPLELYAAALGETRMMSEDQTARLATCPTPPGPVTSPMRFGVRAGLHSVNQIG